MDQPQAQGGGAPNPAPAAAPTPAPASGARPMGVKVIVALYVIFGIIGAIWGFMTLGETAAEEGAVVGVPLIIGGLIGVVLGLFLWKGKNWARIVAIVLSILALLGGITSLGSSTINALVNIVLGAVIAWYLLMNAGAKAFYGK